MTGIAPAPKRGSIQGRSWLQVACLLLAATAGASEVEESAADSTRVIGGDTFGETIIVSSASRRRENVFEAPAAVTRLSTSEISRQAPSARLPELLEQTPSLELSQSGLYDFNVNMRGFNGPLSRRVAVLIDGRDPSIPLLGAQEWGSLSLPLDDLQSVEVLRGPSAALYGPNASSGIIQLITQPPRTSAGGLLRLTIGELSTSILDLRWAGQLGTASSKSWWKLLGSWRSSETFAVSRRNSVEYGVPCEPGVAIPGCLPREVVDPSSEVEGWAGSLRYDAALGDQLDLNLELGSSSVGGATVLTNLGRNTFFEVERPWARARLIHPRWTLQLTHSGRDAPRQTPLSSGLNFALDSEKWTAETQVDYDITGRLRWVGGAALRDESVDSFDPARGAQTLLFETTGDQATAVFAQLEWQVTPAAKLILAGRWDDSETFYSGELSPRASWVWSPRPRHSLRVTYNEAFQATNYVEKLVQADVGPGLQLESLESFCMPFGVSCGFAGGPTRRLAVGNPDLGIEKVQAFEVGYRAILGRSAFLTFDVYQSTNENFITDLLPEHSTPLGDINQAFGAYQPPSDLPAGAAADLLAALAARLGPLAPFLSNNHDGDPFFALLTYGSFGEVSTRGAELAVSHSPGRRWNLSASASVFDFDLEESLPGLDAILSPNAPKHQARAAISYSGERWDMDLSGRWTESFFWSSGVFVGQVPSFLSLDLAVGHRWRERWHIGMNVSNLLDDEHYQSFGGDLISRRALASLTYRW